MSLQQELDELRAEFIRKAPPGRAELYDAKVAEMKRDFPIANALQTGDLAPDFTLPDGNGNAVSLAAVLREGPAVVTFYRGGWCPYCNLQLRAYQRVLDRITALGARLIAISPQLPDGSITTAQANALSFDVLSDVGSVVAKSFGIAYVLPKELQAALTANGKALPGINGDDSWQLPLPATYVIASDRRIVRGEVELDYRQRLSPESVLEALESIQAQA